MSEHVHDRHRPKGRFLASRAGLALLGFLGVGGLLLFTEHRAHVLGAMIYLLPLICIVLHLFMHSGHGSQDGLGGHGQDSKRRSAP